MIVYVVTEGSYSDYHIEAVFDNEEQANLYLKLHPHCDIEEYDTEEIKIDAGKIRYKWEARISPSGKLLSLKCDATLQPGEEAIGLFDSWWWGGIHFMVTLITDRDLDRSVVEKACFDRVAKFKAEFLGL